MVHYRHQVGDSGTSDWMLDVVALFKQGQYKKARELIVSFKIQEYEEVYKFMYRNLELWGKTEIQQDSAVVIIIDGIVKVSKVDPEINHQQH